METNLNHLSEKARQRYLEGSSRLFNLLLNGCDLDIIADIAYEIFENPLGVLSSNYVMLAHTRNVTVEDRIWNEITQNGRSPEDYLDYIKHDRIIEKVYKSAIPVITASPLSKYRIMMGVGLVENKVAAHIGLTEAFKPFEEGDMELFSLLCRVISEELQRNRLFRSTKRIIFEHFITDLLDGKISSREAMEERDAYTDLELKGNLHVLTVNIKESEIENTTIAYAKSQLEAIISDSKSIVHNEQIILIIYGNREKPLNNTELGKLVKYMEENKMVAGLSRNFKELADLRKYYLQSLNAIKMGSLMDEGKVLYQYEDYAVFHLLDLRSEKYDLMDFCHPALLILMEYDQKYSTVFAQSLYTYLENARNIVECARILNVHRNTMSYRIEKIQEIMDVDLNNKELTFHLHLSYKIMGFKKKINLHG